MDKTKIEAIDVLDRKIIGRVDPHIYAFTTNTVPNYLKVGDTYRPLSQRLNEWRVFFPELEKKYENKDIIDKETYFIKSSSFSVETKIQDKKLKIMTEVTLSNINSVEEITVPEEALNSNN